MLLRLVMLALLIALAYGIARMTGAFYDGLPERWQFFAAGIAAGIFVSALMWRWDDYLRQRAGKN